MAFRAVCAGLLLSCLSLTGCGTVKNIVTSTPGAGGVSPFGGVHYDKLCIDKAADGDLVVVTHSRPEPQPKIQEHNPQWVLMLLCAADLPLSLVGDIVTLPYTLGYSWINQPVPYPPVMIANPAVPAPPPPAMLPDPLPTLPAPTPAIPDTAKPPTNPK